MGWFKQIVRASKATYKAAQAASKEAQTSSQVSRSAPTPTQPTPRQESGGGFTANPAEDNKELMAVYKAFKFTDNLDVKPLIAKVNPHASPSTCPYCGVQHDFVAKRARQCPDCSKKMVVRNGVFLTEVQVEKLEKLIAEYYRQQSAWHQLESELRNAQDSRMSDRTVDYFISLAQGFRHAAKLKNSRDSKGFDYWDRAWGYFNQARLEEARQQDSYFNRLPRISYDMADMLVDQALAAKTDSTTKRTLQRAAYQIVVSMGESIQFEEELYMGTFTYERLKLVMQKSDMTDTDLDMAANRVAQTLRLNAQQQQVFGTKMREAKAYEIIGERILY